MYLSAAQQKSDGMRVSCSISLLIAKTISLHTIYKGLIFSSIILAVIPKLPPWGWWKASREQRKTKLHVGALEDTDSNI
ncbi:hypothetical protein T4B_10905 [Trichinella pseudospiralis]|uniref:Uncharacterized protein n=1 Tax=Trichinella pseudospiralis TaxID=6337 RepID=A0A0V1IBP1_TRIPS|nr:hypothetical protein T4B_10905 [Trichinella pseudospiralis]